MEVDHLEQVVRLANALSFTLKTLPNNVDFGNTIFQDTLNSLYLLVDTCNSMQKGKNDKEKGLSANFSNFKIKVEKEETVHTKFENTITVRKEKEINKENFVENTDDGDTKSENDADISGYQIKEDKQIYDYSRVCEIDNMTFPDNKKYHNHMRRHNVKISNCPICKKELKISNYKNHLKRCKNENPFSCIHCEYVTCRKDILQRHMKTHKASNGRLKYIISHI